jgi:hypothetical protein
MKSDGHPCFLEIPAKEATGISYSKLYTSSVVASPFASILLLLLLLLLLPPPQISGDILRALEEGWNYLFGVRNDRHGVLEGPVVVLVAEND